MVPGVITRERARSTFASMGRALRYRNYRLFFVGQGTSLIGTWITRVATSWLVYRLTGSALLLGTVGFAGQIPTFLLAPFAGVVVDRTNRHRVLVVTQVLAMVQSTLLAVLALTHAITVWHVVVLQVAQGLINAFDTPARQAFVIEMVESRDDLANAIALNSSMVNAARLVGPSIAGVLIALVGEGWCFGVDAVSYLAVIASLLAMRLRPRAAEPTRAKFAADLRDGFRYVAGFEPVRAILLLIAIVSFTSMPYAVLMPIFARTVLGGGPHTLGLLMGSVGVGAIGGVLWLAARTGVRGLGRVVVVGGYAFGLGLVAFSFSRHVWLSVPLLAIVGCGMMLQMAASNTLLQTLSDEAMRGRVMSFYTMAFFGMTPFGSLAAGALSDRFDAPTAVRLGGIATLVAVTLFLRRLPALRQMVRPIYVRLGIIPEVAEGMRYADDVLPPTEK
jgi:MFS family permease